MLVKAKLIHLETFEELPVLWNPEGYRVELRNPARSASAMSQLSGGQRGSPGGRTERFFTRLVLDSTEREGSERDLERTFERLQCWSEPDADGLPSLLFVWGSFRFRGVVEELDRQWIAFDADGTPIRGWVDLSLRGQA